MKYILTIDTEGKPTAAMLQYPTLLRTGSESLLERTERQRFLNEYNNAILPDWLFDEVQTIQAKLDHGESESFCTN